MKNACAVIIVGSYGNGRKSLKYDERPGRSHTCNIADNGEKIRQIVHNDSHVHFEHERPQLWKQNKWLLHDDNAPAHRALAARQFCTRKAIKKNASLFSAEVKTAPRFTQPPIKLSTGSFPGVKGDQSVVPTTPPHSSAEVMENMGLYLHAHQVPSWHVTGVPLPSFFTRINEMDKPADSCTVLYLDVCCYHKITLFYQWALILDSLGTPLETKAKTVIMKKRSLKYYREVKQFWKQEEYIRLNSREERTGMAWWRLGIWRLKNKRGNVEKDKCPLCGLAEDSMHIALKCQATNGLRHSWTLTLREEHRLRVFENNVLRKIFGTKRDEVTGEWRKLHNTELHALYSSPDIIRNIKSRCLRWAGHVARIGKFINAYRVLVGRLEGNRPLGRPRRRWEDDIKMDLREVGYDGRDWINLAQAGGLM
ncbi:hypothetical protein ANN_27123 [Periplaneta americana]|uniref:Reverse transcriptase zinc-binding domain-containing protein n=1 Tax=Periplaneta americana TaxID=6978 RepID=A0ABQ8RXA7_PERAM|nr:hypothetical protein ANN_27123 [Periplaneta americana]